MRAAYEAERAWWNEPVIDLASVTDGVLDLDDRAVGIRVYRPPGDAPCRRWSICMAAGSSSVRSIATTGSCGSSAAGPGRWSSGWTIRLLLNIRIRSPLAAVEQAVLALADSPQDYGIDPRRLSIGGDSAGAYLALAATLRLRERRPGIIKFMLLYYGLYGFRDSPSRDASPIPTMA